MSAASELHKAIFRAWDVAGLDTQFEAYWNAANRSQFTVLNELEATPAQPFPYCILVVEEGRISDKMSAHSGHGRNEVRNVPWDVRIYARSFDSFPRKSAKQIAVELADAVMGIFGGHASTAATELTVDVGAVLQTSYLSDFGVREGSQEYSWRIKYSTLLDVPVAT